MLALLLTLLVFPPPDSVQVLYANKDAEALGAVYRHATDRATSLLCRYRLYPLTEDERLFDDLPEALDSGTAREYALLSGLWGYRAARAPAHRALVYGRRSDRLLKAALALAPDDPYVLLIEGQSLLFRPALFGGDRAAALKRFRRLRTVATPGEADGALLALEAELWIWYTLDTLDDPSAPALRRRLLARNLPPLYREFLGG